MNNDYKLNERFIVTNHLSVYFLQHFRELKLHFFTYIE
jgi:hypothetical protein